MQLVLQLLPVREDEHGSVNLWGDTVSPKEGFMVTLMVIGLLLSLAQVVISLHRK
jgi:hypothetical protein